MFADLKLPDANTLMLKAQLVAELYRLTQARKLTQTRAGELMGISQPEVSRLFKGDFRECTIDRLITFLAAFDQDVVISVEPRASSRMKGDAVRADKQSDAAMDELVRQAQDLDMGY